LEFTKKILSENQTIKFFHNMLKNNDDDILSLTGLFGIYNKKVRENQSLDVFHNNLKK